MVSVFELMTALGAVILAVLIATYIRIVSRTRKKREWEEEEEESKIEQNRNRTVSP